MTYLNHPTNPGTFKDFTVEIADICDTGLVVTPSAPIPDQTYKLSDAPLTTPSFTQFTISPTYCPPSGYSVTISPALTGADATAIVFNEPGLDFIVDSSNYAIAGDYTVTVNERTHRGNDSG